MKEKIKRYINKIKEKVKNKVNNKVNKITIIGTILLTILPFIHLYYDGQIGTNFRNLLIRASHLNQFLSNNASNYSQAQLNLDLLLLSSCLQCKNCSEECFSRKNKYEEIGKKIDLSNVQLETVIGNYNNALVQQEKTEKANNWKIKSIFIFSSLIASTLIIANTVVLKSGESKLDT